MKSERDTPVWIIPHRAKWFELRLVSVVLCPALYPVSPVWASSAGRLMLHVVCALCLSHRDGVHTRTVLLGWVFVFCFMGTSSRSKSVLGECADLDMLTYLLDMLFSFIIAYPFDAQRIVKCLLHCSAFALLSYCLGCMAKLKVCIHSRGDWTNWKRSFYCGVSYAQKLCLHEEVQ